MHSPIPHRKTPPLKLGIPGDLSFASSRLAGEMWYSRSLVWPCCSQNPGHFSAPVSLFSIRCFALVLPASRMCLHEPSTLEHSVITKIYIYLLYRNAQPTNDCARPALSLCLPSRLYIFLQRSALLVKVRTKSTPGIFSR